MQTFDVIVIGAGSGSKLIRPVANFGLRVAVIEKDKLGGTCLNRGCIPSKMLIHPADLVTSLKHDLPKFGLPDMSGLRINQSALVESVCQEIDQDSASIAPGYDQHPNITRFQGVASFTDVPRVLSVTTREGTMVELTATKIFIATGCKAMIPEIPGLLETPFMTYKEILRSPTTHESMIVIGGGYIASELGYYAARVGNTRVTFLVREKLLRGEDEEVRVEFERLFKNEFDVRLGHVPTRVSFDGDQFTVYVESPEGVQQVRAKALFVATGVTPDVAELSLARAGIQTTPAGFIHVNDTFETSVPGVFAFGDCIGRYLFKHVANFEGEWLFKTLFARETSVEFISRWVNTEGGILYPPIPHAVFTSPQIAGVGHTEAQAVREYGETGVLVGRCNVADVAMGAALRATSGFVKLIFRKSDLRLVGAHMIGEQASTVIHTCIAFMQMRATLWDVVETIYIHPALVEVVRDAGRDAFGKMGRS
ncbi:mercuric reductase [Chytriomyces cf. hyalinus JEL632]|nr:mercuric reductase [Chytriomyces cf. hyalinus JEL632]